MSNNIIIYQNYTFMDEDDYKYTLSVEDDFTYIKYHEYTNEGWKKKDEIEIPTNFCYEIAKKIIQECEKNNYVDTFTV